MFSFFIRMHITEDNIDARHFELFVAFVYFRMYPAFQREKSKSCRAQPLMSNHLVKKPCAQPRIIHQFDQ